MRATILAGLAALAAPAALAGPADGTWRTEANADGAYLEVGIGPCADDPARTCGEILRAITPEGPRPDYPHIGRLIIADMVPQGEAAWEDGTIWAPDDDKTYDSTMALTPAGLTVEGCVLVFCRAQVWTRAE
ncbi:DUF2147 domain-containing protein [Albimonas pacifica]|uniref:Uncharacterized conserved protein, DUF2147 family n=1 Tax=Albimonas pacifica TaxID=1114924 RepID=A0A1I3I0F1_9RHOB|nr:DUF2147 domain-containing protein [Albimonas pacifica]SFI41313.1 Uncharacterized conserved protein, DUF2147 family [Albimonas pacifica]